MKKKFLLKLTFNQLISSGIHIGNSKYLINQQLKSYLLGYYYNFYIINLYYTNFQLKLLVNLIIKLSSSNQQIGFIRSLGFINNIYKLEQIPSKNLFIYDEKWIHGFLTNFKHIRNHIITKYNINQVKKNFWSNNFLLLTKLYFFPSLFIFFDNFNKEALQEAHLLEIPTAGIIDTNFNFFNILNYSIISNNKSEHSLSLFYEIFTQAIIKGIQNERLKLLTITK